MRANNVVFDGVTTHAVNLDRTAHGVSREVIKHLKSLEKSLLADWVSRDLTRYQRRRIEALLSQTAGTIRNAYDKIRVDFDEKYLPRVAEIEKRATANVIDDAISAALPNGVEITVASVITTEKTLARLASDMMITGAPSSDWWAKQSDDLRMAFQGVIREGLLRGETGPQIAQHISGTRAAGYRDGIMQTTMRHATSLTLTSVQTVAQDARLETLEENADLVSSLQWHSTLDGRTTPQCRALDMLTWNLDKTPIGHSKTFKKPPIHWRCRSTVLPVLKPWNDLAEPGALPQIPEGNIDAHFRRRLRENPRFSGRVDAIIRNSRQSMDGQVPGGMGYAEWLRSKSRAFQIGVLGPERWERWHAGRITMRDLTDNSSRPLTLDELDALIARRGG